jgi:hypothetical protein
MISGRDYGSAKGFVFIVKQEDYMRCGKTMSFQVIGNKEDYTKEY